MPAAILLLLAALLPSGTQQPPACADVASCRQAALDAAAERDYEAFHDLAWQAARRGRPNDPELMLLLARAQSLSGRPGDALVMLRRLADMGIAIDVAAGEDFGRVRALPGWPEVEAAMAAARDSPVAPAAVPPPARTAPAKAPASPVKEEPSHALPAVAPVAESPATPLDPTSGGDDAVRMPAVDMEAVGLAYDSASRRFVVADRHANRLVVADEVFKRVNDLIGAGSAGFGTLTAVQIDRRRGDLWVTSTTAAGGASIHKLQLVSGRVLSTTAVPEELRPAALVDISMTEAGALLLVDARGARLLTMAPGASGFGRPLALGVTSPSSIASDGRRVYVAHDAGLSVADLDTGRLASVRGTPGLTLTGLRRIRSYRGGLVALQEDTDTGTTRLIRIALSGAGKIASSVQVLDDRTPAAGGALTISGDFAYYVVREDDAAVIRKVPLVQGGAR